MRLNLGCGEYRAEGWVNVDLHDDLPGGPRPDVVADPHELPFDDGTFAQVYAGHVLEHIPLPLLNRYLREVRRVLRPDGLLLAVGPACDHPEAPPTAVTGGHRWPGDEHRWRSTAEKTASALKDAGFTVVSVDLQLDTADWPVVDRAPRWQFALLATA